VKNVISIEWVRGNLRTFFYTVRDQKGWETGRDPMSKIHTFMNLELQRTKDITTLFECLINSYPYILVIEEWILQSTPNKISKFRHKELPISMGNVIMIPRSMEQVRIIFWHVLWLDFMFVGRNTIAIQGMHYLPKPHVGGLSKMFVDFSQYLKTFFPNDCKFMKLVAVTTFPCELLEEVLRKAYKFLGTYFLFANTQEHKNELGGGINITVDQARKLIITTSSARKYTVNFKNDSCQLESADSTGVRSYIDTIYFPARISCPPYRWETLLAFIRILDLPTDVLDDVFSVMRLEMDLEMDRLHKRQSATDQALVSIHCFIHFALLLLTSPPATILSGLRNCLGPLVSPCYRRVFKVKDIGLFGLETTGPASNTVYVLSREKIYSMERL